MGDIFTQDNLKKLLYNKKVWLLGDSNVRAIYKDLVFLFQRNEIINIRDLRAKLEPSFMGDKLLVGGKLSRGRDYVEERQFVSQKQNTVVDFIFLTKCLTEALQSKLERINNNDAPDIVIINSCLWDISRWGPDSIRMYKVNFCYLLKLFRKHLPPHTLVLCLTTPPVSSIIKGAVLIKQLEFMQNSMRFDAMEGNLFIREEAVAHGFDVLDVHYHMLLQIQNRVQDGVHWLPEAVRFMSNLILTHISLALNHPLPGNFYGPSLERMIALGQKTKPVDTKITLDKLDNLAVIQGRPPSITAPTISKPKKRSRRPNRAGGKKFKGLHFNNIGNVNIVQNNSLHLSPWQPFV